MLSANVLWHLTEIKNSELSYKEPLSKSFGKEERFKQADDGEAVGGSVRVSSHVPA